MNVINFPPSKAVVAEKGDNTERLYLGAFNFTCTCGNTTQFDPKNIIFKCLEFYCNKCGAPHKLTNPAFVNKPKKN